MRYLKNPSLKTIKQGYKGNATKHGKFMNEYQGPPHLSYLDFIRWFLFKKPRKRQGKREQVKTTPLRRLPPRTKDSIVWLGHAGFLITLNRKRVLIDPALLNVFPLRRFFKPPCKPELLKGINYVCYTHGHRDHLDLATLRRLPGDPQLLVPLGAKRLVQRHRKHAPVQAAGWWQQYDTEGINICFLPAHHWYSRKLIDHNKMLWGSIIITAKGKSVYHSGDTAYTEHFRDIHRLFPKMDVCLMPATYYEPEEALAGDHMPINKSTRAFRELHGKVFIPMHYGMAGISNDCIKPNTTALNKEFSAHKDKSKLHQLVVGKTFYF
ncbi:MBL fold metallo-hydrolase [Candidatus Woesearchaeota archaeon]|nr:MBL fold metallo-hydrolase [Candidatus Woesearchaeota archaeon]